MSSLEDKRYPILPVLRYALWKETPEELHTASWNKLMQTAKEQAVFGLAFFVFEKIEGKGIAHQHIIEYIGLAQQIEQENRYINSVLQRFIEIISAQGIYICVVKGQVTGSCYPKPLMRQSGDIDFWVQPNDVSICETIVEQCLGCEIHRLESEKHVEFQWEGIQFELHTCLASFAIAKYQRYFNELVESDEHYTVNVEGTKVLTLSPTLNALYIFVHLFLHLVDTGVGLRQFCDWMMWLHGYKDDINRDELATHVKALNLEKPYRVLGAILVNNLGLPEEEFPLTISDKDIKRSRRVMRDVMKMGNFGHNKGMVRSLGLLHSIQTGFRMCIQGMKYFDLAPIEIGCRLPKTVWWYLKY